MGARHDHDGWQAFCGARPLLVLLLLAAALALLLTIIQADGPEQFRLIFGFHLLPIVWLVLLAAAFLCFLGRQRRFSDYFSLLVSLGGVQVLVVCGSWVYSTGLVLSPPAQSIAATEPVWFLVRNLIISVVVSFAFARYLLLNRRWRAAVVAESRATLQSLQSRIHPHFLFNALNTISSLIQDKPDEAERATMDLADLLRSGLSERSRHSLGEELELVRGYLRIEQLRLVDRLTVDWRLAEDLPLDQELPALLLQPLVENAVVHGIARLSAGGVLRIEGGRDRRGRVHFVIENPVPDDAEGEPGPGNRMALDNVRQRLELAWEEGARLKTRCENGRFRAELVIPLD